MISIKTFQFNILQVNTYVVWDETGEAAVIDPGCMYRGESEMLCSFIRDNGIKPRLLLNTHLHFDHVFGNPVIGEAFGLKAKAHKADLPWLTTLPQKIGVLGLSVEKVVDSIEPENFIDESSVMEFGNTEFEVLHIPGHSPGSLAFYCRKEKTVFTGDALFRGSIGRTDFEDSDGPALISSINSKLMPMPDDTVVLPGHGPSSTIGFERNNNPYLYSY